LVVSKGHVEVDLNTIDIEIGIAFSTRTLSDGNEVPMVSSVDVKCDIDRHDIKIHLFGNLLTDFGSLFEVFFKGPIANELEKTIRATLTTVVPKSTNAMIGKLDGVSHFPIEQYWMIDWQTADRFEITDTWVGGGFRGLFFQELLGREIPADALPNMPYKDTSRPEKFQNWLSSFTVNSFFNSLTEVADPSIWIRADKTNDAVTCSKLNALLPGIAEAYGADQPVDIWFHLHTIENFEVFEKNSEMKAQSTFDL